MKSIQNNKPYKWGVLEKYPEKYFANYDSDKSPDAFYLRRCFKWPDDLPEKLNNIWKKKVNPPYVYYYDVKGDKERLLIYDYISNITSVPIVNKRTRILLEEFCPNDVQFIDTEIQTKNGIIKDEYYVINILNKVDAIDMEKSDYSYEEDGAINFKKVYFKENSMKGHWIARDQQEFGIILVSDALKKLFRKHKIKGPAFWTDVEAYRYTPTYESIPRFFENNFKIALSYFQSDLEVDSSFQILVRRLDRIPLHMLDVLIEKVSDLSDEGKKRLEKIKVLVEELRQKQMGG
ncbi:MAG: hypothetical protein Q8S31_07705 [Alphaproteobacteria bacterium]|nr:hypothetical protein [Alphaproteobacteria bacterium]